MSTALRKVQSTIHSSCRLCVLRLPRNLRSSICGRGPAASTRPSSPPPGSATKSAPQVHQVLCLRRNLRDRQLRSSGDRASIRSSCRLCVLRLPRNLHSSVQALCLPRNLRPSGDRASVQSSCKLCVLRLPRNLHSGFTECCACHDIQASTGRVRSVVSDEWCEMRVV